MNEDLIASWRCRLGRRACAVRPAPAQDMDLTKPET